MNIKAVFFDKKVVRSAVDRTTRRVFSRFGAFVRRTARSSIRKRKRVSVPGKPPSSHTGLLKKFIFFGYDSTKRSVVIGPARLNQKGRGEAPSLLEYGGLLTVSEGPRKQRKKRRVNMKARAYMGPAFKKEQPKLPAMWRDSIR